MTTTWKKEEPAEPKFQLKIEIEEDVYNKVMHWVHKAGTEEVSGLGKVIYDEENACFRVIDAILLKQENTAGTTDIDAAAVTQAMFELKDTPGSLNWWWHSHVKMAVFWSGTDLGTIETLGKGGWFVSTVFNQHNEMRSCYYQTKPHAVFADNLETEVLRYCDDEDVADWDKEFDEKVTARRWGHYGGNSYSGNYQGTHGAGSSRNYGGSYGANGTYGSSSPSAAGGASPGSSNTSGNAATGTTYLPAKYRIQDPYAKPATTQSVLTDDPIDESRFNDDGGADHRASSTAETTEGDQTKFAVDLKAWEDELDEMFDTRYQKTDSASDEEAS